MRVKFKIVIIMKAKKEIQRSLNNKKKSFNQQEEIKKKILSQLESLIEKIKNDK